MRAPHRAARRALRPAATLLAVLAVLAGLLGMHVLSADHAMAMPEPASHSAAGPTHTPDVEPSEGHADALTAPCQAAPGCPGAAMQAPCTPGSVPAPTAAPDPGACALQAAAWTPAQPPGKAARQRPPTRAPNILELSVSRT